MQRSLLPDQTPWKHAKGHRRFPSRSNISFAEHVFLILRALNGMWQRVEGFDAWREGRVAPGFCKRVDLEGEGFPPEQSPAARSSPPHPPPPHTHAKSRDNDVRGSMWTEKGADWTGSDSLDLAVFHNLLSRSHVRRTSGVLKWMRSGFRVFDSLCHMVSCKSAPWRALNGMIAAHKWSTR